MNYEFFLAESVAAKAVPAATVPTPMPSRSFGMDLLASSRGGVSSHRALSVRINHKLGVAGVTFAFSVDHVRMMPKPPPHIRKILRLESTCELLR